MYTITTDERTHLIRCAAEGFMSPEEVRELNLGLKRAVDEIRARYGHVRVLFSSDNPVAQTRETIAVGQGFDLGLKGDDRLAMVIPPGLAKLQSARAFQLDRVRLFSSEDEARAWLAESDA